MSLVAEQWIFLQDIGRLLEKAKELGFTLTAGETWRPPEMAWINSLPPGCTLQALVPDGNRRQFGTTVGGRGILKSKHGDRLAMDLNVFKDSDHTRLCTRDEIKPLGDYWESLGPKNRWGGNFKERVDAPHFERNI